MLSSPKAEHVLKGKGCLLSWSPPTHSLTAAASAVQSKFIHIMLPFPSLKGANRTKQPPRPVARQLVGLGSLSSSVDPHLEVRMASEVVGKPSRRRDKQQKGIRSRPASSVRSPSACIYEPDVV